MNNKGFTLTELIVTMALLGVVIAIAFPAITKLQTENQKQIYETYEKVLLTGAKLYVDKFDRDLWVNPVTVKTCRIITYNDLIYEDLIKEFDGMKKGEIVDSSNTYVRATKKNNSVTYEVSLAIKQGNSYTYKNIKTKDNCYHVELGNST